MSTRMRTARSWKRCRKPLKPRTVGYPPCFVLRNEGCFVTPNEMRAKALECEHKARATPRSGHDTHDTELATNGASWPTK